MKRKLFVSFSGGETSAMMTHKILTDWREMYDTVVVLFANTGLESEETLEFVNECDQRLNFGTVWVEAVQLHAIRKAATARVVRFETASRKGEPFEDMIRKYGIPNHAAPHCTRSTKLTPMIYYLREKLGWKKGEYDTAIGIRADEAGRRSKRQEENRIVYPFLDWQPTTKVQVNRFWRDQPFRLRLCGYQGNCKTCWKKSNRKLLFLMEEDASAFDFFDRMERQYGLVGPEFKKGYIAGYKRTFFRGNRSVADLREELTVAGGAEDVEDDAAVYGCGGEQCEITFD